MKMPAMKSFTSVCAPNPSATPTRLALASSGRILKPRSSSTITTTPNDSTVVVELFSSDAMVSARCWRRSLSRFSSTNLVARRDRASTPGTVPPAVRRTIRSITLCSSQRSTKNPMIRLATRTGTRRLSQAIFWIRATSSHASACAISSILISPPNPSGHPCGHNPPVPCSGPAAHACAQPAGRILPAGVASPQPQRGCGRLAHVTLPTPALVDLAVAYGVATEYWDWQGRHVVVPAETVAAVLEALGVDASTPDLAAAALESQRLARWRRTLPPTLVMREGWTPWFAVHLPHGTQAEVWVDLEDGGQRRDVPQQDHWVQPQWVDGGLVGEATYQLPGDLPLGYHRLCARTADGLAVCTLVVTPQKLHRRTDRRSWGWVLQLYSVRSRSSWGIGDLSDLADLAAWSGHELGAGFVLVNPLHAAETAGRMEPSPYLPASRRFGNPLYLRVEAVDEFADLKGEKRKRVRTLAGRARKLNDDPRSLDRDRAWALKREALELLFEIRPSIGRAAEYAAFKDREGRGLVDFATWCAIADQYGPNWRKWNTDLRNPHSDQVVAFRNDHADRVEFHCWLQWQLDCQLATAQVRALAAGMPVGVLHDLAVGVHPDGADAWALQDVLAGDINVGAPPDAFNQQGQDWSQPPWRPDQLAETGYAAWRDLVRAVLRHAGYLAGDHVELRDRLGLLTRPAAEELAVDEAERADWLRVLRERRLLGGEDTDAERVIAALHRYVAHTPSQLVGVALTDAVGERRTQNQPGTTDEYPNWRIPLGDADGNVVLLDDLPDDARLHRLVGALSL